MSFEIQEKKTERNCGNVALERVMLLIPVPFTCFYSTFVNVILFHTSNPNAPQITKLSTSYRFGHFITK